MSGRAYEVRACWDAPTGRWWAKSDDIPGLVVEAETFEALVEDILALAPELLELNLGVASGAELPIRVVAERLETVRAAG